MEEQNDEIREISMHRDQNNSEQTDNLATCEFPINTPWGEVNIDLLSFQKAIRNNDLEYLEDKFIKSKEIRKIIEDIGQAGRFDPTEKKQ